jgi:hypothetical protein
MEASALQESWEENPKDDVEDPGPNLFEIAVGGLGVHY